jgi:hypothetical protein
MSGGPYASAIPPGPIGPGNQRKSRGPLIAAISAGVLVSCWRSPASVRRRRRRREEEGRRPTPGAAACGYKIAYLGGLTGTNSADAQTVRNAAKLALDKHNRKHEGCTTELAEFDTKGEADEPPGSPSRSRATRRCSASSGR